MKNSLSGSVRAGRDKGANGPLDRADERACGPQKARLAQGSSTKRPCVRKEASSDTDRASGAGLMDLSHGPHAAPDCRESVLGQSVLPPRYAALRQKARKLHKGAVSRFLEGPEHGRQGGLSRLRNQSRALHRRSGVGWGNGPRCWRCWPRRTSNSGRTGSCPRSRRTSHPRSSDRSNR